MPLAVAFSQEKATFSVTIVNESISEVLLKLEKPFNVRFSFQDAVLNDKKISLKVVDLSLDELLSEIALSSSLNFQYINERYIIVSLKTLSLDKIQVLKNVVVTRYLTKGIVKNKNATFTINPKRLEILPGLIEPDVLESIQLLPGVISPNETATGFTVRGGALDQNRIIWDGINMYHKGHLFGMLSAFNPNSTSSVVFYNKGTHARFGERISSVIDINSTQKIAKNFKAGVGINGINGDFYIETPIIKDKLSIQAALRRSYTELYQSPTFDKIADKVFQNTKITNSQSTNNDFHFIDYNVKLNYRLNKNNSFYFSTIYIDNNLDYLIEDQDENKAYKDLLKIKNDGYSLNWTKIWNSRMSQKTEAFLSRYSLNYNYITSENGEQASDFEKRNEIYDSGLSTELIINTNNNSQFTAGYQYVLKDVSYIFKETSDLTFILDSDKTVIKTHAGYIQYHYKNPKWFDVNLGLRANYYQELDAVRLEPRILIYKEILKGLKLQLSGEIKNQVISEIDETVISDLSLENKLWRLADGESFPIINSQQVSAGFIFEAKGWSLDLDGYYKKVDGKTALSLGFLNPEDPSFHIGKQDIVGLDFYTKKDFNAFKTWVSYSFSDVKSNFEGINEGQDFISGTNINHAVTTSVSYYKKRFQVALAWHWRTGKPFTKSVATENDGVLFFEGINTERLPNYHRLDFSTTYDFNFSKHNDLKGKVGISLRNVYNQKNHLSREYRGNNNLNDPIEVVDKFSLGFTPNFVFRAYW